MFERWRDTLNTCFPCVTLPFLVPSQSQWHWKRRKALRDTELNTQLSWELKLLALSLPFCNCDAKRNKTFLHLDLLSLFCLSFLFSIWSFNWLKSPNARYHDQYDYFWACFLSLFFLSFFPSFRLSSFLLSSVLPLFLPFILTLHYSFFLSSFILNFLIFFTFSFFPLFLLSHNSLRENPQIPAQPGRL